MSGASPLGDSEFPLEGPDCEVLGVLEVLIAQIHAGVNNVLVHDEYCRC